MIVIIWFEIRERRAFMRYVYGNKERVFVNTALGCDANCIYCYLPELKEGKDIEYISAEELINLVVSAPYFVEGEQGTIISIGCYSECLNKKNMNKTKKILEYFLPLGNYIQLATKQEVPREIIDTIFYKRKFAEQASIYISMPTISGIKELEKGTAEYNARINNIERCKKREISVVLYVKPFLENWTYKDSKKFSKIVEKYNIPIVIGGYLSVKRDLHTADVGEGLLYEQGESSLYDAFWGEFKNTGKLYKHSVEIIEYFRKSGRKKDD